MVLHPIRCWPKTEQYQSQHHFIHAPFKLQDSHICCETDYWISNRISLVSFLKLISIIQLQESNSAGPHVLIHCVYGITSQGNKVQLCNITSVQGQDLLKNPIERNPEEHIAQLGSFDCWTKRYNKICKTIERGKKPSIDSQTMEHQILKNDHALQGVLNNVLDPLQTKTHEYLLLRVWIII